MIKDRRHNGDDEYRPTKPEVVAEHPYTKIGLPIMLAGGMALLAWFGNYLVTDIKEDLNRGYEIQRDGLEQINDNVTNIAVNRSNIEDNARTNASQWRAISVKADKPR